MSKVALIRCESYDYENVKAAIKRGIDLIGGIDQFVKKGEKILLKPNLLVGEAPEKCVNTHPAVFKAVMEMVQSAQASVYYGDSPAVGSPENASKKVGYFQIAKEMGAQLADFVNGQEIFFKEGKQNKKFTIAKGVLECDGLISLPKLKTHGLERLTGCIKNQFGCIPGLLKGEFHAKIPDAYDFGKMLVDLNSFINPRLYIMDGIYAMEGNGPRGGTPAKMNLLLFSKDPVALDATVCRLIGLSPEFVPTTLYGQEYGLGTFEKNQIELVGDNFDDFKSNTFVINKSKIRPYKANGVFKFISNRLVPKPVIDPNKCVKCGICVNMCPVNPKGLTWDSNGRSVPPVYQYSYCIRCLCCQELCPEKAISLKKPFIRRIFSKKKNK